MMGLRNIFAYRYLVAVKRSVSIVRTLFYGHGFLKSILRGRPVGPRGEPIPWFTYPAIEYLRQLDLADKRVFEYGAGNSSIFWAQRANQVVTVESNKQWFETISAMRPANLLLLLEIEKERYVSAIEQQQGKFDVIVIDGKWRNACAHACIDSLSDDGLIIFDNSDRHYQGCTFLRERGFFQIDFSGFSAINGYASTTSLLLRAPTRMQARFRPARPVGGLGQMAELDD